MSKRTYEEYIKNDCHPVGYNEPCQSYLFGQTSVDLLLDRIDQLEQELAEHKQKLIVPRFKVGQEIWHILCNDGASSVVRKDVITNIKDNIYSLKKCRFCAIEEELFATEQEALNKLKEMQGNE